MASGGGATPPTPAFVQAARSPERRHDEEAGGGVVLPVPVPPGEGRELLAAAIEVRVMPPSPAVLTPAPSSEKGVAIVVPELPGYSRLRGFLMMCVTWSATLQSCLGPFFPIHMREKFDASALMIGGVFAVLSIAQSLVCPFIAALSRRIGRANTLRLGIILSIAGGLTFSLDRIWAFYLARILQVPCVCACVPVCVCVCVCVCSDWMA
jgi:hypothetical protein